MPKIKYKEDSFKPESLERIELINEVLEEYSSAGYEMTLRQAYYQMVARGYIPNNDKSYATFGVLVNRGRMNGLIDWDHIIDTTREVKSINHWTSPAQIIRAAHSSFSLDKWKGQKFRVEVWVEKDAAVSIVSGICNRLDIPYFSCRGYTGQAAMWGCAMRLLDYIQKDKQIPVILHFGDHDPSGIDMSRDIEERLSRFLNTHFELDDEWPEWYDSYTWESNQEDERVIGSFIFNRVALNMSQILRYNPPPNPTKLSDSRAKEYLKEHGEECWELDALTPNVVEELITAEVSKYINITKQNEIVGEERTHKKVLEKLMSNWWSISKDLLKDD